MRICFRRRIGQIRMRFSNLAISKIVRPGFAFAHKGHLISGSGILDCSFTILRIAFSESVSEGHGRRVYGSPVMGTHVRNCEDSMARSSSTPGAFQEKEWWWSILDGSSGGNDLDDGRRPRYDDQ
jgi:hypothetical protein